jgi:20S proteasome alpha/beta subunit
MSTRPREAPPIADSRCFVVDLDAARSVVVFKNDEDKILQLDKFKLLAGAGPTGDRVQFSEYIQRNIQLYELRVRASAARFASPC